VEVDGGGTRVAEYAYYPGTDRPHSVRRNGSNSAVYYYGLDHPGHVLGLFNTSGALVWQTRYSTFGSELAGFPRGAEPSENFIRFAGRELDVETGFYHMRARYYDPRAGRFISEDPIGLGGGINAYVFAANNPMNWRDPSGLQGDPCNDPSDPNYAGPCMDPVVVEAQASPDHIDPGGALRRSQQPTWTRCRGCNYLATGGSVPADLDPCGRFANSEQCTIVRKALVTLFTSQDPECRKLGSEANERFLNGRFGFDVDFPDYAWTGPNWRTILGIPNTTLGPSAFDPGELANTIAHEQYHAESVFHSEGRADALGYQCAGPL